MVSVPLTGCVAVSVARASGAQSLLNVGKLWCTEQLQPARSAVVRPENAAAVEMKDTLPPQGGPVLSVKVPTPALSRLRTFSTCPSFEQLTS